MKLEKNNFIKNLHSLKRRRKKKGCKENTDKKIMINVISSSRYKINRKLIKKRTTDFLLEKGISQNNLINIVFVGRNKMRSISSQYKKENEALPVLSFLYDERQNDNPLLGEIILCYPQAVLIAAQRNKKVDDTLMQLIEHGIKNLLQNI